MFLVNIPEPVPSPTRPPRSPVKNPTFPGGNTFLDLEDAPSLAEQIRGLRRVSSCPVLERHREAHVEDNAQTVQTPVSPKSPLSEPHVQDQGKEQIDQTDQAAARTRLSSSAKMFQPKPVATVPAPSTTYFAAPPSRTYAMQGVAKPNAPQPAIDVGLEPAIPKPAWDLRVTEPEGSLAEHSQPERVEAQGLLSSLLVFRA